LTNWLTRRQIWIDRSERPERERTLRLATLLVEAPGLVVLIMLPTHAVVAIPLAPTVAVVALAVVAV
jgi:hypothetical protein